MSEGLKPCPFCGTALDDRAFRSFLMPDGEKRAEIWCEYCGATSGHADSDGRAAELWNRRTMPAAVVLPKCDCQSANNPNGKNPPLIADGETKKFCVDACIALTIQALWANGIKTRASCCGHNLQAPNVIIEPGHEIREVHELIKICDDRLWTVQVEDAQAARIKRLENLLRQLRNDLDDDPEDDAPDWMHLAVRSIDKALAPDSTTAGGGT